MRTRITSDCASTKAAEHEAVERAVLEAGEHGEGSGDDDEDDERRKDKKKKRHKDKKK